MGVELMPQELIWVRSPCVPAPPGCSSPLNQLLGQSEEELRTPSFQEGQLCGETASGGDLEETVFHLECRRQQGSRDRVVQGMVPAQEFEVQVLILSWCLLTVQDFCRAKSLEQTEKFRFELPINIWSGTSLEVQWLRIRFQSTGMDWTPLIGKLRFHMSWGN